jgi:hypothetical protein
VVGLGLGGYWLYGRVWPGDEKLIRSTFEKVAAAASIKPGDGTFAKMGAVNELLSYFAPDVSIALEGVPNEAREIEGLAALRELALASHANLRSADVRFTDVFVEVDSSSETATAHVIGDARISGVDQPWYQELKVILRKLDGKWKIARVEAVKGLTM